jgi:TetR/AcrR family transcriptional regulator, regulator of cefoperazone and chloramphenicol sensitivity
MSQYATSQSTKAALIEAAGELFAENGVKAVTTRAIAEQAGENIGNIHYPFGGKQGLLMAVLEYATRGWEEDPLNAYLDEHEDLFETLGGQAEIVTQLVSLHFHYVHFRDRPKWCSTLVHQVIQNPGEPFEFIFRKVILPTTNALTRAYKRIAAQSDDEALLWSFSVVSPCVIGAVDTYTLQRMCKGRPVSKAFLQRLRDRTIQNALAGLGL